MNTFSTIFEIMIFQQSIIITKEIKFYKWEAFRLITWIVI